MYKPGGGDSEVRNRAVGQERLWLPKDERYGEHSENRSSAACGPFNHPQRRQQPHRSWARLEHGRFRHQIRRVRCADHGTIIILNKMPNYRRAHVPGGSFFFTLKTEGNAPVFDSVMARTILGRVLRETKQRWPVDINAIVLLPDHMHTIWTLPRGDSDFSTRWAWLKKEFTRRYLKSGVLNRTHPSPEKRTGVVAFGNDDSGNAF